LIGCEKWLAGNRIGACSASLAKPRLQFKSVHAISLTRDESTELLAGIFSPLQSKKLLFNFEQTTYWTVAQSVCWAILVNNFTGVMKLSESPTINAVVQ
jgi:hypothetical protein